MEKQNITMHQKELRKELRASENTREAYEVLCKYAKNYKYHMMSSWGVMAPADIIISKLGNRVVSVYFPMMGRRSFKTIKDFSYHIKIQELSFKYDNYQPSGENFFVVEHSQQQLQLLHYDDCKRMETK
jgi:hypothetical protein